MDQKKGNGLECVETGSQSYLSGLLGFDDFEREDYENDTEDDLRALGIEDGDYQQEIDSFLKDQARHPQFGMLLSRLDPEAQKYIRQLLAASANDC